MSREAEGADHRAENEPGTRDRILAAGRDLFRDRGFEAVSIREIGEAAGVNSALIYYYFRDKEELYQQVLVAVFGHLLQHVQETIGRGGESPGAALEELAHMYVDFLRENQGNIKLMYYELARGGSNFPVLAENFFHPAFAAVRRIIEQGIGQGVFRDVDPSLSVLSLISLLLFYFIGRPVLGHLLDEGAYSAAGVEAFLKHTLDLFFHGMTRHEDGS